MSGIGFFAKVRKQPVVIRFWSDRTLHLFGTDTPGDGAPADIDVRINDLEHIERFEQTVPWLTRDEFIADCRSTLARPDGYVFTVAEREGPLLGYAKAQANARESYYPHVEMHLVWPERTGTMYGAFVHPAARGRRLHAALQKARHQYLIRDLGMRWAVHGVIGGETAAINSTLRGHSRPIADLVTRYRLGRVSKSVQRYEPAITFVIVEVEN